MIFLLCSIFLLPWIFLSSALCRYNPPAFLVIVLFVHVRSICWLSQLHISCNFCLLVYAVVVCFLSSPRLYSKLRCSVGYRLLLLSDALYAPEILEVVVWRKEVYAPVVGERYLLSSTSLSHNRSRTREENFPFFSPPHSCN